MVLKAVRDKVDKTWTTTKKVLAVMSVWGLFFSLITLSRLGVAFSYDDTLVDSSASRLRAARAVQRINGPEYWRVVNNSYEIETPKILPYSLALILRGLGFRILILADRDPVGGEALQKDWRRLSPGTFLFAPGPNALHPHLQDGRWLLFFGSSDADIQEARRAGVFAIRIKRAKNALGVGEYNPHRFREPVLPLSNF